MPRNNDLSKAYFAGLLSTEISFVDSINGGGNSRVFKITVADGSSFVAKVYPGATADGRDRLRVESHALEFMRQRGIECVPQLVATDEENQCALFEHIEGDRADSQETTEEDIDQATQFLTRLDGLKNDLESGLLPDAAEACFSAQQIIDNLESRIAPLESTAAAGFLTDEFGPVLRQTVAWCRERTAASGGSVAAELDLADRTLSPSDFGFHNAIRRNNGELAFLDFEYFGWDDPTKIISDFLLHPAMDLSPALKARFVANMVSDDPVLMDRLETVFPLFGLKWCLVLLNAFIPQYRAQRGMDDSQLSEILERQSEKARLMLSTVESGYERFP